MKKKLSSSDVPEVSKRILKSSLANFKVFAKDLGMVLRKMKFYVVYGNELDETVLDQLRLDVLNEHLQAKDRISEASKHNTKPTPGTLDGIMYRKDS